MVSTLLFQNVTVIGLGLIGSSVARALSDKRLSSHITGYDKDTAQSSLCISEGFIQAAAANMEDAVKTADLVVIATPPSQFGAVCDTIIPHLKEGAIVIDVLSVKQIVANAMPRFPAHATLIPCHPIAGSEKTGAAAGSATLFLGRKVILCPPTPEETFALLSVRQMWESLGSEVEMMPADAHDVIYAHVSHLPQLIAFAAAPCITERSNEILKRFSRLFASDTSLWADIFLLNPYVPHVLKDYRTVVKHIADELSQGSETQEAPPSAEMLDMLSARVFASCLVAVVTLFEKHNGFKLARFAGAGFADIACPAIDDPDADIEAISQYYQTILQKLNLFATRLEAIQQALTTGDKATLAAKLLH